MSKKLPDIRRTHRPDQTNSMEPNRNQAARQKTASNAPIPAKARGVVPVAAKAAGISTDTGAKATDQTAMRISDETAGSVEINVNFNTYDGQSPRRRQAMKIVGTYAAWSSAFGLLPVPFADVAGISATQISMVAELSKFYGVAFSKNWIRTILGAIVGGATPWAATAGIVFLCKGIPGVGLGVGLASMAGL